MFNERKITPVNESESDHLWAQSMGMSFLQHPLQKIDEMMVKTESKADQLVTRVESKIDQLGTRIESTVNRLTNTIDIVTNTIAVGAVVGICVALCSI
ncbi:hypothetical protein MKW92_032425 [Papaver armeniacum]|nr:hypothetical protein MKW92_032425 [Papaver armeniacum]